MATYGAVEAVGRAVVRLLQGSARAPEMSNATVALFGSEDFEKPMNSGLSIYLYRIELDSTSGNLPPVVITSRGQHRPPLALKLHYMLTAWGGDAPTEHRLIGWVMRVLADTPILPSELLNAAGARMFGQDEPVELILEEPALTDLLGIWSGMKSRYRLSISFTARLMIDSATRTE